MEMIFFRRKNVFFIAHTLFLSIKKTTNCNDIVYYFKIYNHLEYVDLKSEISEVSAHSNYFRVRILKIFNFKINFLKNKIKVTTLSSMKKPLRLCAQKLLKNFNL